MSSSVALYEALTTAPDDRTRARVIAEAFERLEERYPHLPDLATRAHLSEAELRLQKEGQLTRSDLGSGIDRVRADLKTEIAEFRNELKSEIAEVRNELKSEIAEFRNESKSEIAKVRADQRQMQSHLQKEILQMKVDLLKRLVPLMFAQVAAITALVKLI